MNHRSTDHTPAPASSANTSSWTEAEIRQQPACWQQVLEEIQQQQQVIEEFLAPLLARTDLRILLTGAGTSAFIGEAIAPWLAAQTGSNIRAVASTDIVSNPRQYLPARGALLLISFARSGNSPESVAAVQLAQQCVADCYQLIITCNASGKLHQFASQQPRILSLLMPPQTDDRGFAMTSSASTMMLSCLAILAPAQFNAARFAPVAQQAQQLLDRYGDVYAGPFAETHYSRVVYLASGSLCGLAREAALKVLELTAGKLAAFYDTPLGFRHGPKSIVDGQTLVIMFISTDPYTRQYDVDLLAELRRDQQAARVVALAPQQSSAQINDADCVFLSPARAFNDMELAFCYLILAQLFALSESLKAGITPDHPSATGTVNRVVQGVVIYPYSVLTEESPCL